MSEAETVDSYTRILESQNAGIPGNRVTVVYGEPDYTAEEKREIERQIVEAEKQESRNRLMATVRQNPLPFMQEGEQKEEYAALAAQKKRLEGRVREQSKLTDRILEIENDMRSIALRVAMAIAKGGEAPAKNPETEKLNGKAEGKPRRTRKKKAVNV